MKDIMVLNIKPRYPILTQKSREFFPILTTISQIYEIYTYQIVNNSIVSTQQLLKTFHHLEIICVTNKDKILIELKPGREILTRLLYL
jgi:hypothetical protein